MNIATLQPTSSSKVIAASKADEKDADVRNVGSPLSVRPNTSLKSSLL
jgi:hypothetical protein